MFYLVIAEENKPRSPNGGSSKPVIRALSYAPGPLDTDMQEQIRNDMPPGEIRNAFTEMHRDGKLIDPADSARVLLAQLELDTFINGSHVDYYDVCELKSPITVGKWTYTF